MQEIVWLAAEKLSVSRQALLRGVHTYTQNKALENGAAVLAVGGNVRWLHKMGINGLK